MVGSLLIRHCKILNPSSERIQEADILLKMGLSQILEKMRSATLIKRPLMLKAE